MTLMKLRLGFLFKYLSQNFGISCLVAFALKVLFMDKGWLQIISDLKIICLQSRCGFTLSIVTTIAKYWLENLKAQSGKDCSEIKIFLSDKD